MIKCSQACRALASPLGAAEIHTLNTFAAGVEYFHPDLPQSITLFTTHQVLAPAASIGKRKQTTGIPVTPCSKRITQREQGANHPLKKQMSERHKALPHVGG